MLFNKLNLIGCPETSGHIMKTLDKSDKGNMKKKRIGHLASEHDTIQKPKVLSRKVEKTDLS